MSVHTAILKTLLRRPGRVAVVDDRRSYRGIEIVVAALHLAQKLEGTCRTETVATLLPSSGAFPIAALAGWMLGKAVVPLNFFLKPDELQYVIDDCGTDTIVTAGAMLEFMKLTPRVDHLVRIDELDFHGIPEVRWPARKERDDLAVVLYTSGTSGRPKGVMLTHGNLESNLDQIRRWISFTREDVMVGVLPQFHSFGLTALTLVPLVAGIKVVYSPRFVPHKVVRLIREHRGTILVAIPSMYGALLSVKDAGAEDLASLRIVVSGGEPLPASVAQRMKERFGITLNEGYGLTETSPVTNWCRPGETRPHSVGMPLPDVEERIVDLHDGRVIPRGSAEEGEVQVRGPNVMKGYLHLPKETAEAFTEDGFFRTGDIGRMDADGHLYITGRLKEMMIIGGENVFPREIEEVLNKHPGVGASAVVPVADDLRGEQAAAFVEMKEGSVFDEASLKAWCRERLAGYKVPVWIRAMEQLPRNATGKILRRELRGLATPAP